jgi:hypothetical protein
VPASAIVSTPEWTSLRPSAQATDELANAKKDQHHAIPMKQEQSLPNLVDQKRTNGVQIEREVALLASIRKDGSDDLERLLADGNRKTEESKEYQRLLEKKLLEDQKAIEQEFGREVKEWQRDLAELNAELVRVAKERKAKQSRGSLKPDEKRTFCEDRLNQARAETPRSRTSRAEGRIPRGAPEPPWPWPIMGL